MSHTPEFQGVWPVMLTPFHAAGGLDWDGLEALVEWYLQAGVSGLFAVCLSSEMFHLTPTERVRLAARVVKLANGRVPVAAAGAFAATPAEQAALVRQLADTGVQAVVLTANQLAAPDESETVWRDRASALFEACPEIPLGLYECPLPDHRTLTPALLNWVARTGRVHFIKDTCCHEATILAKLAAIKGTPLRWFNAHCPTLLASLRAGGHGYSGVAANAYPELFVRLCAHHTQEPAQADRLQRFLTLADFTLRPRYPACAKLYLGQLGLPMGATCRRPLPAAKADDDERLALANLRAAVAAIKVELGPPPQPAATTPPATGIGTPAALSSARWLANDAVTVYRSPDPARLFAYSPGIARLPSGRLLATLDLGGPGAAELPGCKYLRGESGYSWQGRILSSDDGGRTWTPRGEFPFMHARPFVAGQSVYILGHAGDLQIIRSDDDGLTWSAPAALSQGQFWHQAPCNVHYAHGCVYLVMERRTQFAVRGWYVGEMAPVLMRGRLSDDLTVRANWSLASELTFREVMAESQPDYFGVPVYAADPIHGVMVTPTRHCNPMGWLETNVVQFHDPAHQWHDPTGRTFHLWLRAHTGGTGYACLAQVVEQGDTHGTGAMHTSLVRMPSGKTALYLPCPGGQMKFHVLYDAISQRYWLLSTQATDSMTRPEMLPPDRYNLPNNERRRLQLHFSKNMVDWCFAGLVATGPMERASRHYASMAIDGDDLVILSRSGDEQAKTPHDGNLITFHRLANFRALVY